MEASKQTLIGEKDAEGDVSNKRKIDNEEDLFNNKRVKQIDLSCKPRKEESTNGFTSCEVHDITFLIHAAWLRLVGLFSLVAFSAMFLYVTMARLSTRNDSSWIWLLLSVSGTICWAFNTLYTQMVNVVDSACNVSLHVRAQGQNKYLVEALADVVGRLAIRSEADVEVEKGQEDSTGASVYKLMLLPKSLKCSLRVSKNGESHVVHISSLHSDGMVCGPKQELQYPTEYFIHSRIASFPFFLSIPFRFSSKIQITSLAADQKIVLTFIQNWLADVYTDYMRANVGMVEVLQLQKESSDWGPEWKRIRKERAVSAVCKVKSSAESPCSYYSIQPWARRMRKHAEFGIKHAGRTRTSMFLHGEKGCGKTLFVEWLASELDLPIYCIDLRADFINDSVLRDSITPNKLRHNLPVLFHIDEFQSMIDIWSAHDIKPRGVETEIKVTIQGLQTVLEGIATPNHALFMFTSSRELPLVSAFKDPTLRLEWAGLLRRFSVQEMIPLIGIELVSDYFIHCLNTYFPGGCDEVAINEKCQELMAKWSRDKKSIPFDMLSKYLEQQLRTAYVEDFFVEEGSSNRLCVLPEKSQEFMTRFFESDELTKWPLKYAGGANDLSLPN